MIVHTPRRIELVQKKNFKAKSPETKQVLQENPGMSSIAWFLCKRTGKYNVGPHKETLGTATHPKTSPSYPGRIGEDVLHALVMLAGKEAITKQDLEGRVKREERL